MVDGYVDLDPDGRPGLGAHVHAEFGVPVIGVAKTAFESATHAAQVLRGQSARPLYVTAAGMTAADAADLVAQMAGRFRMPDALKRVDRLARGLELPQLSAYWSEVASVLAGAGLYLSVNHAPIANTTPAIRLPTARSGW